MHGFDDEVENVEVSMTPLIDCVFLLLVFFLVSTMTHKELRDIDVDLAESKLAESRVVRDDNQVIGIQGKDSLYLNGEAISMMSLHQYLSDLPDKSLELRLDIDREAPVYLVVEVMELCQFNQLSNISFKTNYE